MFGASDRGKVLEMCNVQHGTCTVQSYSIAVAIGMHCWSIGGQGMDVHFHMLHCCHAPVHQYDGTWIHVYRVIVYNYCLGLTAADHV